MNLAPIPIAHVDSINLNNIFIVELCRFPAPIPIAKHLLYRVFEVHNTSVVFFSNNRAITNHDSASSFYTINPKTASAIAKFSEFAFILNPQRLCVGFENNFNEKPNCCINADKKND